MLTVGNQNDFVGGVTYKADPATGILIPYGICAGTMKDISWMVSKVFTKRLGLKVGVRTGFASQEDAAEWAQARYWREVAQKGRWEVKDFTKADLGDNGSIMRATLPGLH